MWMVRNLRTEQLSGDEETAPGVAAYTPLQPLSVSYLGRPGPDTLRHASMGFVELVELSRDATRATLSRLALPEVMRQRRLTDMKKVKARKPSYPSPRPSKRSLAQEVQPCRS